ncbi:MAG: peptidyl-prolyl cis-trans isomerase [Thermotogae bacterium]|nr:peptidyl-prolyl cis-trans isomerase [Thermotogota bacterium]
MKKFFLFMVLVVFLGGVALAQEDITPVATVNGMIITSRDLDIYSRLSYILFMVKQADESFYNALVSTKEGVAFIREYQKLKLAELVDRMLLKQWANMRGIIVDEKKIAESVESELFKVLEQQGIGTKELETYAALQGYGSTEELKEGLVKEQVYRAYLMKVFDYVTSSATVTTEEIDKYYNEHKEEFYEPSKVHVMAVKTPSKKMAEAALEDIRNGVDFEEVAKKYSVLSKVDLGWKTKDEIENEMAAEALFLASKGAVLGPYEVENGWMIYKLLGRRSERQLTPEEARAKIVGKLLDVKRRDLWNKWYDNEFTKFKERSVVETVF